MQKQEITLRFQSDESLLAVLGLLLSDTKPQIVVENKELRIVFSNPWKDLFDIANYVGSEAQPVDHDMLKQKAAQY